MADRLQQAIDNNLGHYQAVLAPHGLALRVTPGLASTEAKVPPLHSNALTRSRDWRPDAAFDAIAEAARAGGWADWSIKDSHDVLDLAPHGLRRLFRATWIHLDPGDLRAPPRGPRFEVVEDEEGLEAWRRAWDPDPALGRLLFGPGLLRDPRLLFVAGHDERGLACGCLFNRTGEVLGISNFFARPGAEGGWSGALRLILDRLGPSGVVGYARDAVRPGFEAMGFRALGPLSVWHRPRDPGARPA